MPRTERPLDAADTELGRFAAGLRALREQAGSPTYREMARRANYSVAALSKAASGRKLPSLAVTLAYVEACGGDPDEWREQWRALAAQQSATASETEPDSAEQTAPYVGLAAFQTADADRFFGREDIVNDLLSTVSERRFTGVFGASGSGKSSVLMAGLVARSGLPAVVFTPGPRPMEECAVALAGLTGVPVTALLREFAADPKHLHLRIREAITTSATDRDLLVVVDQFEELFTLCTNHSERTWLVDALVHAANAPTSRARVVLGVRADFYGQCGQYNKLVTALRGSQILVGAMSTEELRQAITQPATDAGCMVETALVSRVIADATGQPAVLPLVSHALLETWRRRGGATLTLAGYEAAGGIHHAIAHSAEQVHLDFTPAQQEIARQLFLRLIALGESTEDTKRRVRRHELGTGDVDTVLERLAQARLLTLDRDTVEITHEALIRCWPRLRDWLAEDREGLRIQRQLTEATEAWEAHAQDSGALYRGTRLAVAREWSTANRAALTERERRFLEASITAENTELTAAKHRTRRLRQLIALLAVLLTLATVTTVLALNAEQTGTEQRNVAIARRALSDASEMRAANPALSLQLTLAAHRLTPLPETRDALLSAFATPYANRLVGHTSNEVFVAYNQDGRLLATVSWDHTLRLWDMTDRQRPRELVVVPLPDALMAVAFGQNGSTLATVGQDHIRLWDVRDPQRPTELATMPSHTASVASVAFTHSDRVLATATDEKNAQLWDISDPRKPRQLAPIPGALDRVGALAVSPNGQLLAAAGSTVAQLWDISDPSNPRPLGVLNGHTAAVSSVAFSPDGRSVATASWDHALKLWDITDPNSPRGGATLTGHTTSVISVAFSRDGQFLASTGGGTILWDVSDVKQPRNLTTIPGGRYSVAFSPDGTSLAAVDDDRTVRLQELQALPLVGHHNFVVAVAYSLDGRTLATGSWDGTARLWEVTEPTARRPLATLAINTGPIRSIAFSPDGRTLAVANDDGIARLWDVGNPREPRLAGTVKPNAREAYTVAYSPDGKMLAVGGYKTISFWDVTDRANPRELSRRTDYQNTVWSVVFSPDGRTVITSGLGQSLTRAWDISDPRNPREWDFAFGRTDVVAARSLSPDGRLLATWSDPDKTVRLVDMADPARPKSLFLLPDHGGMVWMMAFSPDSRRLATVGANRTIKLWDVSQPSQPRLIGTFSGHTADTSAVAFSPDGQTLASVSLDHTARFWHTDVDQVARRVCQLAQPTITRQQWDRYLPELPYQPPCP